MVLMPSADNNNGIGLPFFQAFNDGIAYIMNIIRQFRDRRITSPPPAIPEESAIQRALCPIDFNNHDYVGVNWLVECSWSMALVAMVTAESNPE